jgi:hypothetical protein
VVSINVNGLSFCSFELCQLKGPRGGNKGNFSYKFRTNLLLYENIPLLRAAVFWLLGDDPIVRKFKSAGQCSQFKTRKTLAGPQMWFIDCLTAKTARLIVKSQYSDSWQNADPDNIIKNVS